MCLLFATSLVIASDYGYKGSTTAAVNLVGGIIKSQHIDTEKKYPRKDCPVCKGTGKYLSGDGIKMVDCGYCEPDKKDATLPINRTQPVKPTKNNQCEDGTCPPQRVIMVR